MLNDILIRKACDLVWLIPGVSFQQAMELVGIQRSEASCVPLQRQFKWQLRVKEQDRPPPKFSNEDVYVTQRYEDLFALLGGHQCTVGHVEMLRLVGLTPAEIYKNGTKTYSPVCQRLGRWRKKEIKQSRTRVASAASASASASVSVSELTSNFLLKQAFHRK